MNKTTQQHRAARLRYFVFCPHCRARFLKKKIHIHHELVCPSCGFIFWQGSAPTASCCIINGNNEILLTKRGVAPFKGMWDVPGGFLDFGEHPERGVRREIKEELSLRLPHKLTRVGIYMDTYAAKQPFQSTMNVYYLACVTKKVKLKPQDDVTEARWFPLSRLPKIAFANGRAAVRDLKKRLGL